MSVETPEIENTEHVFLKPLNGGLNGVSNGHPVTENSGSSSSSNKHRSSSSSHKSSSKDKHREKSSSSSSSRDKDRDREKDKHRSSSSSSSSSKDKEKSSSSSSSSHKSSSRDKDRKDRDKDKEPRDKDKERDKNKEKDKNKDRSSSSSSSKDKEKSKDHKSSRDKDKDKSSSSSSRDKDKDREKDKERSKDKDRHKSSSSSSSKDKHSSSSSSSKSKDRHSSSSSKDKDRNREKDKEKAAKALKSPIQDDDDDHEDVKVKNEDNGEQTADIKREEETCDYNGPKIPEDPTPEPNYEDIKTKKGFNVSQASSCDYSLSQFREDESQFDLKAEPKDVSGTNEEEEAAEDEEEQENDNDAADTTNEMQNSSQIKVEGNSESDEDDIPLSKRKKPSNSDEDNDEDDVPLLARKKIKTEVKKEKKIKKKKHVSDDEDDDDNYEDEKPKKKKIKKEKTKAKAAVRPVATKVKQEVKVETSPTKTGGRKKKEEEQSEVWKWWEEEKRDDGVKWNFLEHKGPVFAPPYIPLPQNIKFYYDGKEMKLSQDAEEIACFYSKMLEHEYTSKKVFNDNFFKDWRKSMTSKEKDKITDLKKCNFKPMCEYFKTVSEQNKNRTKEEKLRLKEENEALLKEYGFCIIDGHKEKIGNFKIEPPGLFRGRGEHPKMGMVKRRVVPEDVLINCAKDGKIPKAPDGRRWKEVRHDNTVTWLASWCENVQGQVKYVMLNPSSKLKGEKDWQKYEIARKLHKTIDKIRKTYTEEWKSKEMRIRQRAVALYFIDKLALRAGNEKDEDQADTVGCCSLRVEHIELHKELDGKEYVVVFDFLGKDSIRYYNAVAVEKRVFKNLELFKENKKEGDDLFDRLNTSVLNDHLRDLMDGLTAKVFRTYNASITLQNQLDEITDPNSTVPEKLLSYNRANRAVAILCNHQRSVPKGHEKSMSNLKEKIQQKREQIDDTEVEVKELAKISKRGSMKDKIGHDKKQKQLQRLKEQLKKLELQETDRDENKTIALGTSKLNYLDPRISVAWCKKNDVPIEKIFNKTQRDKFRWAIEMVDENYSFIKV